MATFSLLLMLIAGVPGVPVQASAGESAWDLTTPTGVLSGTLLLPSASGKVPVVLIVAGSGPTDRDGNSAMLPGKNNAYKLLAEALRAGGIASVRYDKRGIGASAGAATREADLRFETFVGDAAAWIQKVRADARFSTITVAGHSEGSLIGMLAAASAGADAFVSISGPARNATAIIREQLRPLPPDAWQQSERILALLEAGTLAGDVPTTSPFPQLYRASVQPYLISWFKYTPSAEIAKLTIPILILQGTTDMQVTRAEADALHAAAPRSTVRIVDGMNHVMKRVTDPGAQMASYIDPTLPVVADVPQAITTFVGGVRAR